MITGSMMIARCITYIILLLFSVDVFAQDKDKIELETTIIKGNKELPKILYVVPWQDRKKTKSEEQQLQLHSLFGDLFDPVVPDETIGKKKQE